MRFARLFLRGAASALAAAALAPAPASAQAGNPNISVIVDTRAFVASQDGSEDPKDGDLQFELDAVEFALQAPLNPYVRGDVFAAWSEDEGFVIEEAYATFQRGLPGGLQVRAGKFRVDFGKLNLLHPHAYSFLDTPLAHRLYLGEEGLADIGVNANAAIPLGNLVLTPSVNLLQGDFAASLLDAPDGEPAGDVADEEGRPLETGLAWTGRLGLFVPTGDYAGFEVGVNALSGSLDEEPNLPRDVTLLGADVKYRWAPDKFRGLTAQAEWIRSEREVAAAGSPGEDPVLGTVEADGFYGFVDYRFRTRWNVGAILERAGSPVEAGLTYRRAGLFGGFSLMEETTLLRLLLRRTESDAPGDRPVDEAVLQLVFSLGPHRAHWF